MTQEALKQMYQLLLTEPHAPTVCLQLEAIAREALAQPEQEPVGYVYSESGVKSAAIQRNLPNGTPLFTTPPQRTEQKMVMWPCLIDTADFSKGAVTVVMQCEDYKVSAGTHWLSTTPPQRTEQNFCSRCGKRTKDLTHIHTCTPPQGDI